MALSGTYTHSTNKLQLITDALRECNIINSTQTVDGEMYNFMSNRLNDTVKRLQTKGLHLWRTKPVTLLLVKDQIEYTLGTGGDRCSETVVRGLSTTATAIAATTYDVPSTGMAVSDIVGIEMTDGEMHWDTIATIPDAASITVSTGPTTAASTGAVVYSYTSLIPKPLRIHEAYTIPKGSEGSDVPITVVPREEYLRLNSKASAGTAVQVWFNPERTVSKMRVWPVSDDNIQRIVFTAELPLDDMTLATDTLNFPDYWLDALHLKMSHIGARAYEAPRDKVAELRSEANEAIQDAEDFGAENTYIEMHPEVSWAE